MSAGRPEILFPLFADLTGLPGVGPKTAKLFERLEISRRLDLVLSLPTGLEDRRLRDTLLGAMSGDVVTVQGTVVQHHVPKVKTRPHRVAVQGGGTTFELVYFKARREWLEASLPIGAERVFSGKVEIYDGRLQMPHPDLVLSPEDAATLRPWEPVYPLTQGLTQRVAAKAAVAAIADLPELPEWIAPSVLRDKAWPGWHSAVTLAHNPEGPEAMSPSNPARQRLAYDELLSHQLALQLVRARMRRGQGRRNQGNGVLREKAMQAFGHAPTGAQSRAMAEIAGDMADESRMMRLLQGDVGSGKTLVALDAMLTAVEAGGQAALMAPTEILARQHAEGLQELADAAGVKLVLLTGRDSGKLRTAKLMEIGDGTAQLVLGTHALFQKDVRFNDLRPCIFEKLGFQPSTP